MDGEVGGVLPLTDKQIWITHFNYELSALAELPWWADHLSQKVGYAVPSTACAEAALLHARLLIEFLAGRRRRNGARGWNDKDVTPADFLPGEWTLSNADSFGQWLDMIDPYLAHLSMERADGTRAPGGYLTSIADDVISATAEFVDALTSAGVSEAVEFQAALRQAKAQRMKGPVTYPRLPPA